MKNKQSKSPILPTSVDRNSPLPLYVQVKNALLEEIENGNWSSGDQIDTEIELCKNFGVSSIVVKQALKELAHEGYIVRRAGVGTFVAAPKIKEGMDQAISGFYHEMYGKGYSPSSKVLRMEIIQAKAVVAEKLQIRIGAPVWCIERLRFIGGEPVVLVTTHVNYICCPDLNGVDLSTQSLYTIIFDKFGIKAVRGTGIIDAVAANEYEANLLQVEKGSPLLKISGLSFSQDNIPIEYYYGLHRSDRAQFEFQATMKLEPDMEVSTDEIS